MAIKMLLKGMGLGAGLMYLWDPQRGRRRRAQLLDQLDHAKHCTEDFLDKAQRDLSNRATGVTAEAYSMLGRHGTDDRVITARVRSKLGRYCSHPHALDVDSQDGQVVLSGQILEDEVADVLKAVRWVRGVRGVENRLEIHRERGNISALQGGAHPIGEQFDFLQENWSPATRALGQAAGLALMGNCLARRNLSSVLLGTVGFGLFLRGSMNRSLAQITGMQVCPQAVRLQRSVTIHAPTEKVWNFISDFEQVGRFLPNVKSVQNLGGGRYRWGLHLPGGQDLELEERVTENVPQERLSWESVSNHPVSYSGTMSLQREEEGVTRVNVHVEYTPPGGALGAALGSLFGVDAESKFHDAVMRIKPYLETGNAPHDLHEVRTESAPTESQSGQTG